MTGKLAALGIVSSQGGSDQGARVKTVLLKDKHCHVFVIVALPDTNINLKALSTRLGLGKALLQPLPEAVLSALLQSPANVTFLGLADSAAQQVVSLLDARAVAEPTLRVPAADGSEDITMSGADVEKFLRSLGGASNVTDLSASPKIDRDHPPDLRHLADGAAVVEMLKSATASAPAASAAPAVAAKEPAKAGSKVTKTAVAAAAAAGGQPAAVDVARMTDSIVAKCLSVGSGQQPDAETMRTLRADVLMEVNSLKNAAYASGFAAARGAIRAQLESSPL